MKLRYPNEKFAGLLATLVMAGTALAADIPPAPATESEVAAYYTVKPGDTLQQIAKQNNLNYQQLAEWNALESPYRLMPGQLLLTQPSATQVAMAGNTAAPAKPAKNDKKSRKPEKGKGKAETTPSAAAPATPPAGVIPQLTKVDENGKTIIVEYVDFSKGPEPIVIAPPTGKPD